MRCVLSVVVGLFLMVYPLRAAEPGAEFFLGDKIWKIHFTVTEADWKAMTPAKKGAIPNTDRDGPKANAFGLEFNYVHATLEIDGQILKDVGLRFKGNSSYQNAPRGIKYSFKVNLNHYVAGQTLFGEKEFNLNNNAFDASQARESLSYELFRAAGVPAPRTSYAEVSVTIGGQEKQLLGLYTIIEEVDKAFLKMQFDSSRGMLMKPERFRAFDYRGDEWAKYKDTYRVKGDPTPKQTARLIELCKIVGDGDDAAFKRDIGKYVDVPEFQNFLAVNMILGNMDSLLSTGHNFFIYLPPNTDRVYFIPWDLNMSFGGFAMPFRNEDLAKLSIEHPHAGPSRFIDRLLAIPEVKAGYTATVRKILTGPAKEETLKARIDAVESMLKESIQRESKLPSKKSFLGFSLPTGVDLFMSNRKLGDFMASRLKSIQAQLDGRETGMVPMPFGPGNAPPGNDPIAKLARTLRESADKNRDGKISPEEWQAAAKAMFEKYDRNKDGQLDERELAEALRELLPPPVPKKDGPKGP